MRRIDIPTAQTLIAEPGQEPLTLEEVKLQRRISATSNTLNKLFGIWVPAARQHFEEQTGRQCITATWEYWLAGFPCEGLIELPKPPLQAVESVVYIDASGDEQTLDEDSYTVEAPAGAYAPRGRIVLGPSGVWPTTVCDARFSVRVRFTAGYGDTADDVPALVRASLMFLVGHFHKFGEEVMEPRSGALQTLPLGASTMIEAFKYSALPIHPPSRYAL